MFKVRSNVVNCDVESQYNPEDLDKMDMSSLNLFGVPIEEAKEGGESKR